MPQTESVPVPQDVQDAYNAAADKVAQKSLYIPTSAEIKALKAQTDYQAGQDQAAQDRAAQQSLYIPTPAEVAAVTSKAQADQDHAARKALYIPSPAEIEAAYQESGELDPQLAKIARIDQNAMNAVGQVTDAMQSYAAAVPRMDVDANYRDGRWVNTWGGAFDPYGDPADQQPAPTPPLLSKAGIERIVGADNHEGTFHQGLRALGQQLLHAPTDFVHYMGDVMQSGLHDPSMDKQFGSPEINAQRARVGAPSQSAQDQVVGPQSMIGHGVQAAQAGQFGQFLQGVPAGIGKETVENPVGQIMNLLALTGAGEMTLSAGGRSLLKLADANAAAAAERAAAGDTAGAEAYAQAAQRARDLGQSMNRGAFHIHRTATFGKAGDAGREYAAGLAEKYFPDSAVAKALRHNADYNRAAAAHLAQQRAAAGAERATAKAVKGATVEPLDPGMADLPVAPPDIDAEGYQRALPAPAAEPGSPLNGPQGPEAPAPETPPVPGAGNEAAPMNAPPEPAVTPLPEPMPLSRTTSPGGFTDPYNAARLSLITQGLKTLDAQGVANPMAHINDLETQAMAQLRTMYDEPTGLLHAGTLGTALDSAAQHVGATQEPVLYARATLPTTGDPAATRAVADFLAGRTHDVPGHVSFYDDAGRVGAVYAGPHPSAFLAALAAAQQSATRHQTETGQSDGSKPPFTLGASLIQPEDNAGTIVTNVSKNEKQNGGLLDAGKLSAILAAGQPTGPSGAEVSGAGGGAAAAPDAGAALGGREANTDAGGTDRAGAGTGGAQPVAQAEPRQASGGQAEVSSGQGDASPVRGPSEQGSAQPEAGADGVAAPEPLTKEEAADLNALTGKKRGQAGYWKKGDVPHGAVIAFLGERRAAAANSSPVKPGSSFLMDGRLLRVQEIRGTDVIAAAPGNEGMIHEMIPASEFEARTGRAVEGLSAVQDNVAKVADDPDAGEAAKAIGELSPEELQALLDEATRPLGVGDVFDLDGTRFQITQADERTVRADDVSSAYPIGRVWSSREAFERQTGRTLKVTSAAKPQEAAKTGTLKPEANDHATTDTVRNDGATPMAAGAAEDVRSSGSEGTASERRVPSAGTGQDSRAESDGAGVQPGRSRGSRPTDVPAAAEREADAGTGGEPRSAVADIKPNGDPIPRAGRDEPELYAPGHTLTNYHVTEADAVGIGGQAGKRDALIAALETLRAIEARRGLATPEEQAVLVRFPGWGWTGNLLHPKNGKRESPRYWDYQRVTQALTQEERNAAGRAALNSHYTPPEIIEAMWTALRNLGFSGGNVLEPSAGIGLFFGLMPSDMMANSRLRGVEKDSLTGRILGQLYQDAKTETKGFEDVRLPNDFYDLAISNVPFGNIKITDAAFARSTEDGDLIRSRIHNYFMVRALQALRPGGIEAFITSAGTMNAGDNAAHATRGYLARHANLLGAIRLPNTAFQGNAATEVTTDILFFQKRGPDTPDTNEPFLNTVNLSAEGDPPMWVNEYFVAHPEMVLGTHSLTGKMNHGGGNEYTLLPDGRDIGNALREALARLPQRVYRPPSHPLAEETAQQDPSVGKGDTRRPVRRGMIALADDGTLVVQDAGDWKPLEVTPKEKKLLAGYVGIREKMLGTLEAQRKGVADAELTALQADLKKAYDAFVKAHGPLGRVKRAFIDDPEANTVLALEKYDHTEKGPDGKAGRVTKLSDIFSRRVIVPEAPVESVGTPQDALTVVLREGGKLDFPRMENLTGMPAEDLQRALLGTIYKNPDGDWETRDEYGSGNVRAKLARARQAAEDAPGYKPNVDYLETVQPTPLKPGEIAGKPGAQWIPKDVYQDFLAHLIGGSGSQYAVLYAPETGRWKVVTPKYYNAAAAEAKWGTPYAPAYTLFDLMLNSKTPKITEKDDNGNRVVLEDQTQQAQEKQVEIRNEWDDWLMRDPKRATMLADKYNQEVNVYRKRQFDGSFLTFPGKTPGFQMRIHQVNAVWRIMQSRATLLAHEVGTGKTATMQVAGMEMRRIGLRNKIVYVVENSTVPDFGNKFRSLYPAARLLVGEGIVKDSRQQFMAAIATGDWDAIILSHDAFKLLPVHPDTVKAYQDEQMQRLRDHLYTLKDQGLTDKDWNVKEVEASVLALENRMRKRQTDVDAHQDQNIYWDDLGVDFLFVDEAQKYKNLEVVTQRPGLDNDGNQITDDMFMKVRELHRNGGGVAFSTGTPLTNSIAEMHSLLRYLAPELLLEQNVEHFDAWAQQYADMEPVREKTVAGEKTVKPRFTRFSNLPELMQIYQAVVDPVLAVDVPELKRPALVDEEGNVTNRPIIVASKPNQAQMNYYKDAVKRAHSMPTRREAAEIKAAGGVPDGHPKLSGDLRHVTLDARLRMPGAPDYPGSKLNQVVEKVLWNYNAPGMTENKRTQLIFCDLGVPNGKAGFNCYDDIKKKLVAGGIPAQEIRFIHEAGTDNAKKQKLFDGVVSGDIRVLIGSRGKMGVGVNVQDRLCAIHQVDPVWRPDIMEQADGRVLRHGNLFEALGVRIYQYVVQNSFDEFMWNNCARKAGFIKQVTTGNMEMREAEDIEGDETFGPRDIEAVASGDPQLIELAKLEDRLKDLRGKKKAHINAITDIQREIDGIKDGWLPEAEKAVDYWSKASEYLVAHTPDKFTMTVAGKEITKRPEAGKAVLTASEGLERWSKARDVGVLNGFTITAEAHTFTAALTAVRVETVDGLRLTLKPAEGFGRWNVKDQTGLVRMTLVDVDPRDYTKDATGLVVKLENSLKRVHDWLKAEKANIAELLANLPTLEEEVKKPFSREAELRETEARVKELAKLRDKNKNASGWGSELAADDIEPTPEDFDRGRTVEPVEAEPTPDAKSQASRAPGTGNASPSAAETGNYPPGSTLNMGVNPRADLFIKEDVLPELNKAAGAVAKAKDWVRQVLSPASASPEAGEVARMGREYGAAEAQAMEIAHKQLLALRKPLGRMSRQERLDFYDAIETGQAMPTPELQTVADTLRGLLDDAAHQVQALGTGKLRQLYVNYMPHIYKERKDAEAYYAQYYGDASLQSSPGFLKERKYATLKDAMAAGLEPISDDPIELVLMKLSQMHRYLMAQRWLMGIKSKPTLSRFVAVSAHAPGTWEQLAGTEVWGGSTVSVKEGFDERLTAAVEKMIQALGGTHTRKPNVAGGAWGRHQAGGIETKFAGPESVLIHELGHLIDDKYQLWDYLQAPRLRVPGVTRARKTIASEMRDLADLRFEGQTPAPAYRGYVRQKGEKVANAILAMIYAPEKFAAVAPTVKRRLEMFLTRHPELAGLKALKPSLVQGERTQALPVGGLILKGKYWAPPDVARIYNNYLSPGLQGNVLYDSLRWLGNAMNQMQLGLSGFHFTFVCLDAVTSQLALTIQQAGQGMENAARGERARGLSQVAQTPRALLRTLSAPFSYAMAGRKFHQEYYNPGSTDALMAQIVDAAISGGFRAKMDRIYTNESVKGLRGAAQHLLDAGAQGNVLGVLTRAGALGLKLIPAAVEALAYPLMEIWVPLMKAGACAAMLRAELDALPAGTVLDRDTLRKLAARCVDSVDNRLGQMAYDNLFWNKVLKDAMMVGFRSVGWNVGDIRELGGSVTDAVGAFKRMKGGGGAGVPPGGTPPGGPGGPGAGGSGPGEPFMTPRIAYALALALSAGVLGAVYTWLHTGEKPKDAEDLYFPRTGKVLPNGEPERVALPNYAKDVYAYGRQPFQTLANKTNPVISAILDITQNRDYYGTQIHDDVHTAKDIPEAARQSAKFLGTQFLPFSVMNTAKRQGTMGPDRVLEGFFGVTPAPKDLDYTTADKMMIGYLGENMPGVRTQAQQTQATARQDLRQRARGGEDIRPALRADVKAGDMTRRSAHLLLHADRHEWRVNMFKRLHADQALRVFEAATPEEKKQFAPLLRHKEHGQGRVYRSKAMDALRGVLGR